MTFKELLIMTSWENVFNELKIIDSNVNETAYKEIYNDLLSYDPIHNDEGMTIRTEIIKDDTETYIDVFGTDKDNNKYGIELTDWKEWLGYYVNIGDMLNAEFVAHCLWEMTFYGNEQDVINKREELNREQEKIRNGQYRDIEEICIICNGTGKMEEKESYICNNGKMTVRYTIDD